MLFLDFTATSPEENLAFDETMLLAAEAGQMMECLRVWDATSTFVVLGRGSRVAEEVNLERCSADSVPVLRRISGGATILAAPGCMFYTVLLSIKQRPQLQMLDHAHQFVMQQIQRAVEQLRSETDLQGTCDLTLAGKKVSGNALRVTREWVLYHGSLLLNMNLQAVSRYLFHPPREPDYRGKRGHADFVANLEIDRVGLTQSLRDIWQADEAVSSQSLSALKDQMSDLVPTKYGAESWNLNR